MKQLAPGINPVLMTPLKEGGGIDTKAYRAVVPLLLDAGVHGLVVLGSMGELPYLSDSERRTAIKTVVETCGGKVQVIAGATAFGAGEAVRRAKDAVKAGADALMVPLPVYFPLRFKDIKEYYKRVAGEAAVPIIYYHIPSVTHLDLDADRIADIFEIENITGIKESIMDLPTIKKHIRAFPDKVTVYSGSTLILRKVMGMGGRGAICPIPNIIPETVLELYNACAGKHARKALQLEKKAYDLAPLFYDQPISVKSLRQRILAAAATGTPMKSAPPAHALVKEALRLQGHPITPRVAPPLPQLSERNASRVKRIMKNAGLIEE